MNTDYSVEELRIKKRRGDFSVVAEMVGIADSNARAAFKRVGSKYHIEVVEALKSVIKERERLINKKRK